VEIQHVKKHFVSSEIKEEKEGLNVFLDIKVLPSQSSPPQKRPYPFIS
jgi:hypothetical protein